MRPLFLNPQDTLAQDVVVVGNCRAKEGMLIVGELEQSRVEWRYEVVTRANFAEDVRVHYRRFLKERYDVDEEGVGTSALAATACEFLSYCWLEVTYDATPRAARDKFGPGSRRRCLRRSAFARLSVGIMMELENDNTSSIPTHFIVTNVNTKPQTSSQQGHRSR
jgi:hypothetical protein